MAHIPTASLQSIADALDLPLDAFWADAPESELGDMVAILGLWLSINDPQARRRVLSFMRREAERQNERN